MSGIAGYLATNQCLPEEFGNKALDAMLFLQKHRGNTFDK